ncbi:P-loop containing nucleoside triphosphate hydrolase protein [Aspergillus karnatakaensis]|uniref:P-loop containing nucleoside triphosphate hydrolase protein n=1 Tax=Aspergillus karnatakaensis TaxID=1810916 RepID=UPI003CCE2F00
MSLPAKQKSHFSSPDRHSKATKPSIDELGTAIIHRVECNLQKDHADHPDQRDFYDTPRLFSGDSKASELRGERRVTSEDNDEGPVIWMRVFDALEAPHHPTDRMIARYFHVLRSRGPEAQPVSEEIIFEDEELQEEIRSITDIETDRITTINRGDLHNAVIDRLYTQLRRGRETFDTEDPRLPTLLRIVDLAFQQEFLAADSLISRGCVTRRHLPKLFRPGEVVRGSGSLVLPCSTVSFDGQFYREAKAIILNWEYGDHEVDITELGAYPLDFNLEMRARLLRRGSIFWQFRGRHFVSYSPGRPALQAQTHVHSTSEVTGRDYLPEEIPTADTVPDELFQLQLPATVPGFGFHDKKWISLSVEGIREIEWNAEAFKHLVLKSTKKELIEALVAKHTAASGSSDVIEGKGNGLIMLLHGGPGTGKTLTAESVAELTRKPLYRVTCGDIGTNAEDVERYLESVLYLGTVWQCVVLLDEADVFLEERTQQDHQRNALVSVFLRVLEYYSGILVLTSNRIGTFDEAFKSRSSRRRIWSNFITRLQDTNSNTKADQILENIDQLAKFKLNGREIRNSIRTATLLAEFRGERLEFKHLVDVIDISNEFEQYLQDVHGHTASEWAMSQRVRKDE